MTRAAVIAQLGRFGQPLSRRHRAGRVDRIVERRDVAACGVPRWRRDAAAALEHDQQIVDRPVAQRVGQHDIVADQLVALRA